SVRDRAASTGENFSVRSVLGVASGPTPDTDAPAAAGAGGVGASAVGGAGGVGASAVGGAGGVGAAEGVDDDEVYARALAGSGRTDGSDTRRRGSTRSDGTDGSDPA